MGSLSPLHWLIVLVVVLVLFGGGSRISSMMGDFAKGIKSFKKNMSEDESMEASGQQQGGHIAPPGSYPPNPAQETARGAPVQPGQPGQPHA